MTTNLAIAKVLKHQLAFVSDTQHRYLALCGGFGCVAGETIVNGVEISDLSYPSISKTLQGDVVSTPAYCKGKADLYQVETASGRSVTVTTAHRFLTQSGWLALSHLAPGSVIAVDGSENDDYPKGTTKDLLDFDLTGFHPCDEFATPSLASLLEPLQQLVLPSILRSIDRFQRHCYDLCAVDSKRLTALLWALWWYALKEKLSLSLREPHTDEQAPVRLSEFRCIQIQSDLFLLERTLIQCCKPYIQALRPSESFATPLELFQTFCKYKQGYSRDASFQLSALFDRLIASLFCGQTYQFHETLNILSPYSCQSKGDRKLRSQVNVLQYAILEFQQSLQVATSLFYASFLELKKSFSRPSWDVVKNINFDRHDLFYDIHVPIANHYVAQGIYHHNSGKTKSLCFKAISLAAQNIGTKGAIYSPTHTLALDTVIPEMDDLLEELNIPFAYRASPLPKYILQFPSGDATILIRSFENWRRIRALNLSFACVDELDVVDPKISKPAFKLLMGRIRVGNVRQVAIVSTPEGFGLMWQFFVKEAREKKKKDRRIIYADSRDNPFLPKDFIDDLLENYPPELIKAYLAGQFVNLTQGAVYSSFDRKLNNCNVVALPDDHLHIGMDFNVGKMAAVVHVLRDGLPRAVDEFANERDTPSMIAAIKSRYPMQAELKRITIYPDASGGNRSSKNAAESDISLIVQAGLRVVVDPSNPAVKDRVNAMNSAFHNAKGERRYLVNTDKCPTYTEALEQQVWKDGEPDKTQGLDHICDSGGYCLAKIMPISVSRSGSGKWGM